MASFSKVLAAAGALGLALCCAAQAADLGRNYRSLLPPTMEPPSLPVDEFATGWYLRGDVGYRFNKVNRVDNAAARAVIANNFADSWLVGLGAGFKWQWLRADLTADYGFRDKFQGTTASMADDFTANFDTFSALANVYGDLGTWFGFTPYVGAGVGMAHLSAADFIQHFQAAVAPADTGSKWNLAWALMAGVSYDISNKYAIDVGYRHINMGNVATGTDAYGNSLTFHNLAADEIRVGFRYMID